MLKIVVHPNHVLNLNPDPNGRVFHTVDLTTRHISLWSVRSIFVYFISSISSNHLTGKSKCLVSNCFRFHRKNSFCFFTVMQQPQTCFLRRLLLAFDTQCFISPLTFAVTSATGLSVLMSKGIQLRRSPRLVSDLSRTSIKRPRRAPTHKPAVRPVTKNGLTVPNKAGPASSSNTHLTDVERNGCTWSRSAPDYEKYHDEEWGTPLYDDRKMFEFLLLETFQAGLNWLLVLRKREHFRVAFCEFDVDGVAALTEEDVQRLMTNSGIIRNSGKIRAAISNARAVIQMRDEGIGLSHYFWSWVDYQPIVNSSGTLLSKSELSDQIAKDLKRRGFKFVGSTVVYSHLQAVGIINDHHPSCKRHCEVQGLLQSKPRSS